MPGYGKLWTPMENRVFHSRPHLPTALGKRSDLDDSISSFPTFPQPLLPMFCKKSDKFKSGLDRRESTKKSGVLGKGRTLIEKMHRSTYPILPTTPHLGYLAKYPHQVSGWCRLHLDLWSLNPKSCLDSILDPFS